MQEILEPQKDETFKDKVKNFMLVEKEIEDHKVISFFGSTR
jgi:hypothetical protein